MRCVEIGRGRLAQLLTVVGWARRASLAGGVSGADECICINVTILTRIYVDLNYKVDHVRIQLFVYYLYYLFIYGI